MWKNLKSYFIVEDESANKRTAKTLPDHSNTRPSVAKSNSRPAAAPPTSSAPASAPKSTVTASASTSGTVNDRSIKVLMEAMEQANLPGFDYLEYKKALQNLKKMDFTDSVRFQTAYAAAQSMGVTPKQLEDSAAHYLNVLAKEQQKFSKALSNQRSQQVGEKEKQLKQLGADIQRQEAKIKELQAQIEKSKAQQTKLRDTIAKSTEKLTQTQADFETTLAVITDGIKSDISSIKEYLK